jgi:hypothetical protein
MTAITWFKHHHGAALDAKWLAVADMAGSTPANVWSIFSGALEFASEQDDRGSIAGLNPHVIASFYRIAVGEVRQVLTALKEIGVIVADRIAKWAKRQGTNLGSPARPLSPGALRTRKWRRNKAADERQGSLDLGVTVTQGVTQGVTNRVTETVPLRERDTEKDSPPAGPPEGAARGDVIDLQREKTSRGTRLAEDFVVPAAWLAEAAAARERAKLGRADLAVEAVKFTNHFTALSGPKGIKHNWRGAWINWCLNPIVPRIADDSRSDRVPQHRTPSRPLTDAEVDRILGIA